MTTHLPPPTLQQVKHAHHNMNMADEACARLPHHQNAYRVLTVQRTYYAILSRYNRANHTPLEATTRRIQQLIKRAAQNRRLMKDNPMWQQIALNQMERISYIRMRHYATLAEAKYEQQQQQKAELAKRREHKRELTPYKRVINNITGGYVSIPYEVYERILEAEKQGVPHPYPYHIARTLP